MPLYDYSCHCGYCEEFLLGMDAEAPSCPQCGNPMLREIGSNVMVKMKGEGGYPSRKRQVFNTTYRKHPKLNPDKNRSFF